MAATKIATDTLINHMATVVAERKEDGRPHNRIFFEGEKMNIISFAMFFHIIEESDVKQFYDAVKAAGGTPWDDKNEVEFIL